MRFALCGSLFFSLIALAESPASGLWAELEAKRAKLTSFHQEFEITQTYKVADHSQSSKRQVVLDMSNQRWREMSSSGSGDYIRIFDGSDLLQMEDGGDEYLRSKHRSKEAELPSVYTFGNPDLSKLKEAERRPCAIPGSDEYLRSKHRSKEAELPSVYTFGNPDLSKLKEAERRPCAIPGSDHVCVVLEVPLKRSTRYTAPNVSVQVLNGNVRAMFDTETGLLIAARMIEGIDNGRAAYQFDVTRILKRVSFGAAPDASLFKLPSSELREVKELSRWNAARMKKELAGKPAPELTVTDLRGEPIALSALKGRTVLLDFWTTWCPPCRADAPVLDKLHQKYGEKELTIVGISVSEERAIVEKFLKEFPHAFPVVLTTENEMPRPYQVGVFPTYIVINQDGSFAAAVEGDKGFGDLRKLLKKAGMETE